MTEVILTVTNPVGLHARPAKLFVETVRTYKSTVTIQNLSRPQTKELPVTAFNLLQIGVRQGHQIRLRASGEDEAEVIAALTKLVEENFGE
ncbi:HPr family phosphocarrier protein [Chloroflexus sp.]|uniref:HPr family phosphocarrier protein n=1 Tax=Chloroflexus sp. TaxID=1904827 RepID=UPI00404B9C19